MPPAYSKSVALSVRSSWRWIFTPLLRNACSRRRWARVSKLNSSTVKISLSGMKRTLVPVFLRLADRGDRRVGLAAAEGLEPDLAVALDLELEQHRERVHHRDADAVETAGDLVDVVVELTARVELGHDHFGGRAVLALVQVDRNAAAVVLHRDAVVGVDRDHDLGRVAGLHLVDRVVDELEDHVVQTRGVIGVADVHAGPLADRFEPFEDLDVFGGIGVLLGGLRLGQSGVLRRLVEPQNCITWRLRQTSCKVLRINKLGGRMRTPRASPQREPSRALGEEPLAGCSSRPSGRRRKTARRRARGAPGRARRRGRRAAPGAAGRPPRGAPRDRRGATARGLCARRRRRSGAPPRRRGGSRRGRAAARAAVGRARARGRRRAPSAAATAAAPSRAFGGDG